MVLAGRITLLSAAALTVVLTGTTRSGLDPQRLVLPAHDFPKLTQKAAGDPASFGGRIGAIARNPGYVAGYAAAYVPNQGTPILGVLAASTGALIFDTNAHASDAVEKTVLTFASHSLLTKRRSIGSESYLCTTVFRVSGSPVAMYWIFWRQGKVVAEVTVTGIRGTVKVDQALALAKKQAARVAHPPPLQPPKPPTA